jgi:hypothetical protein
MCHSFEASSEYNISSCNEVMPTNAIRVTVPTSDIVRSNVGYGINIRTMGAIC